MPKLESDMCGRLRRRAAQIKRTRSLLGLAAATALTSLACGSASSAVPPRNAAPAPGPARPALPHEQAKIVVQPALEWRGAEPTHQGTAFFVTHAGRAFAVTSAHFLELAGPNLDAIGLRALGAAGSAQVARATESWGAIGHAGVDPVDDLREDYVIMPLAAAPSGYALLELDAGPVQLGDRVWLPDKDEAAQNGHRAVLGTVTDADIGYIAVELDGALELTSQSGSPLLSASSGKVIGILSRGEAQEGKIVVKLTPARALLAAIAAGSTAVPLAAQVPQPAAPPAPAAVTFRFAWPDAIRATLHARRFKEGTGRPTTDAASAWRMTATTKADELEMRFEAAAPQAGQDPRASAMPTRRVSKAGDLVALEDTAPLLAYLKEQISTQQDPRAIAALQDMFSEQALLARAREDWGVAVANWIGAEFEPGATYAIDGEATLPMFGGLTVKTHELFTVTANVSCHPGDAARRCARIDARSFVDRADMARAVRRLMDELMSEGDRARVPPFKQLDVRTRKRVITDPATLVPHSVRVERYMLMTLDDPETGAASSSSYELRDERYEYP